MESLLPGQKLSVALPPLTAAVCSIIEAHGSIPVRALKKRLAAIGIELIAGSRQARERGFDNSIFYSYL
jgi:hypothetical protein